MKLGAVSKHGRFIIAGSRTGCNLQRLAGSV
jgi:hypothetical protein